MALPCNLTCFWNIDRSVPVTKQDMPCIALSLIIFIAGIILFALGVRGVLPPMGNLPAMILGGMIVFPICGAYIYNVVRRIRQVDGVRCQPLDCDAKERLRVKCATSDSTNHFTVLHETIQYQEDQFFAQMVTRITSDGGSIGTYTDGELNTVWHWIAVEGTAQMVTLLKNRGIAVTNQPNNQGFTPHQLAEKHNRSILKELS